MSNFSKSVYSNEILIAIKAYKNTISHQNLQSNILAMHHRVGVQPSTLSTNAFPTPARFAARSAVFGVWF